jgi:hypothetical protein
MRARTETEKSSRRKTFLIIAGITAVCLFLIAIFVKIAEWGDFYMLQIYPGRWGLTEMDVIIIIFICFGGAIFAGLYLTHRNVISKWGETA